MLVNFTKMHGTGNDFVMINGFDYLLKQPASVAERLCDRHFGIGADGLILILPAENKENDFRMRIFNSNGSEAEMCGNGIRCFAHYVFTNNLSKHKSYNIETLAGIITPKIINTEQNISQVKVNMGKPYFRTDRIPVNTGNTIDYLKEYPLEVKGLNEVYKINCVSMGNPHSIIFTEDVEDILLEKIGPLIECADIFPEKTNVEFIEIVNKDEIIMRVWERGAGITLACGTGATASAIAGIKNGILNNEVLVHLPGGDLKVIWNGEDAYMTGPAETVFSGGITI